MKQAQSLLTQQVKAARRVSVPLVAITTPDPAATIAEICEAIPPAAPLVIWDIVEGLRPRNEPGKEAIAKIVGEQDPTVGNPVELLRLARKLPDQSLLFVHLANRWVADPTVIQGAWNLRDEFKANHRMLVLLGPDMPLPAEISGDVVILDEPLPDAAALATIVKEQHQAADLKVSDPAVAKAVEAVQGLPAFQAEQVVAMSLTPAGLDVPALWERKRRQIELTAGLKVHRDPVRFEDVGGVPVIKEFLGRILGGQARPNAVVFIDEIEKFIAGSSGPTGDSSGVSQDQLGTLLAYMQDHGAAGSIFVGPPGSGKSMLAKAAGNEGGIPTIQLDLGAMKNSLVGASEQNLRSALKVITSVSNGRSLWLATCNSIAELPPELRRRFTLGTFFFDLPDADERKVLWKIYRKRYGLAAGGELPDDDGWTGAEIRQACDIAWRLGCKLIDAAQFVVPVSRSAADQLDRLRKAAEGKFLSASLPGVYRHPGNAAVPPKPTQARKLQLQD
jgi:hypothetical protein